jgi:hypothetical protein
VRGNKVFHSGTTENKTKLNRRFKKNTVTFFGGAKAERINTL